MEKIVFIDKDNIGKGKISGLGRIVKLLMGDVFSDGDNVAIKLHMGEMGNKNYLKPWVVKAFVDVLKGIGVRPFLFDSPVIYLGGRDSVKKYYRTAAEHGFTEEEIGCSIVISDDHEVVKTEHLDAEVCKPIIGADGLLVLSHLKGHMCSGFGGAIKNLGMGGVSIKTKAEIHSFANPMMVGDCNGCGTCVRVCPVKTVSLKNNKACFDYDGCWGCGLCVDSCPSNVLKARKASFDKLIAEGASAVLKNVKKRYFVNVLMDITKLCDCCSNPGGIVLDDIGVLMGKDIVAVEKASFDLINKMAGKDLFKEIHRKSPLKHIKEAERIGLGNLSYELIEK